MLHLLTDSLLDPLLFSTHQTEGMSKRISSSALGEFAVYRRTSNDHVEAYSANGRRAIFGAEYHRLHQLPPKEL